MVQTQRIELGHRQDHLDHDSVQVLFVDTMKFDCDWIRRGDELEGVKVEETIVDGAREHAHVCRLDKGVVDGEGAQGLWHVRQEGG